VNNLLFAIKFPELNAYIIELTAVVQKTPV